MSERTNGLTENDILIGGVYMHLGNPNHLYTVLDVRVDWTEYEETEKEAGCTVRYRQDYDGQIQPKGSICTRSGKDFLGTQVVGDKPIKKFTLVKLNGEL